MTLRRGFNRLFIAVFVCWNLWNLGLVFKKARESVASANEAAEELRQVRQNCVSSQERCASARRAGDTARAKRQAAKPEQGYESKLDTPEQFGQSSKRGEEISLEEIEPLECSWFNNINCEALYARGSEPSIWRECKSQLADTKTILYIEGIPVGVYISCWIVSATFLWIATGFGMAGAKKRG